MVKEKQPEGVLKELAQETHDFSSLNGQADDARTYIAEKPYKNADVLKKYLSLQKKTTIMMRFDKIEDLTLQNMVLHMPEKRLLSFLDADEAERNSVIENMQKYFLLLHEARESAIRIQEKTNAANEVISSIETLLSRFPTTDSNVVKETEGKINSLKKELKNPHPDETKVDQLILDVKNSSSKIVGEEKIMAARNEADQLISIVENKMKEDGISDDVKTYFTHRIASLKELKEGTNVYAIQTMIEDIGKELVEKTDKGIRAQEASIKATTKMILRFILKSIFKIEDNKFPSTLEKVVSIKITPEYENYKAGLGRFARKNDPLVSFTEILRAALTAMADEMIIVHNGQENIDSVELSGFKASISEVDKVLSRMQEMSFELPAYDLAEMPKRLEKTKNSLKKIKDDLRAYFTEEAGYTDSETKDLVDGPLFSDALRLISDIVSDKFYSSLQKVK